MGDKKCTDSTRLRDLNELIHVKCLGLCRLHSDIINNHYYLKISLHFLTLLEKIINDLIARSQILDFHLRLQSHSPPLHSWAFPLCFQGGRCSHCFSLASPAAWASCESLLLLDSLLTLPASRTSLSIN